VSHQSKLRITSRYSLSKRDRRELAEKALSELGESYKEAIEKCNLVEVAKIREGDIEAVYFLDGVPAMLEHKVHGLLPALYYIYKAGVSPKLPSVYVDTGAVSRILNGADVMAPGIRKIEGEFSTGGKVVVKELEKGRPIAIGVALVESKNIPQMMKGKAITNVHYLGDEYWTLSI